jgi:hypothetical protein
LLKNRLSQSKFRPPGPNPANPYLVSSPGGIDINSRQFDHFREAVIRYVGNSSQRPSNGSAPLPQQQRRVSTSA